MLSLLVNMLVKKTLCMQWHVCIMQVVADGQALKVDESCLTGESMAVTRKAGDTVNSLTTPATQRLPSSFFSTHVQSKCMTCVRLQVLSGAYIASGESEAVVTATGAHTFFGKTITLLSADVGRGHLYTVYLQAQHS